MKYKVEHNWFDDLSVEVEIDHIKADPYIKEMVEFWYDWKSNLRYNRGNYTVTFLQYLADTCWRYALEYNTQGVISQFKDLEGWVPMDGSHGIEILEITTYYVEPTDFEVKEC